MENMSMKAKLLAVALMSLSLAACSGGSATNSVDLASRSTTSTTDTTKAWIQCNAATGSNVDVHLMAWYENANTLRNDLMKVRLYRLPSDFASSNSYVQMFRWQGNTAGSVYLDSTPLQFEVWDGVSGAQLLSARSSVRWNDVSTAASQLGITDPTTFFRRAILKVDLRDPNANFDALMTVLYNSSNVEREHVNALLPVFDANPSNYATDSDGSARNQALMNLHPFRTSIGQGWTTADYMARAQTFCSGF